MNPTTLALAGVAALAVILIAIGVATSGGSGISDRLERYASAKPDSKKAAPSGQGAIVDPADISTLGETDDSEFEVLLYEFKADLNAYLASLGGRTQ